jgi:hypothetical protein
LATDQPTPWTTEAEKLVLALAFDPKIDTELYNKVVDSMKIVHGLGKVEGRKEVYNLNRFSPPGQRYQPTEQTHSPATIPAETAVEATIIEDGIEG